MLVAATRLMHSSLNTVEAVFGRTQPDLDHELSKPHGFHHEDLSFTLNLRGTPAKDMQKGGRVDRTATAILPA
ncbi:hypothetical protein [Nonomuraea dietziae]|uniref:hypothetical protein n=1 Tax=Nonomuraea dietziae TaxID=65515 RepID=UPI00343215DE